MKRLTASRPVTDEAALVARTTQGDRRAFETLYRAYSPRLRRFLDRVTKQRPQLVEEILNDTMLVVWRKAATYNGTSKVSTWIFAIAYRKALKALRQFDEPLPYTPVVERITTGPDAEDELQQRQLHALLTQALARLSAPHRAVIELTYYHGFSYPEIALIMACPADTVKTRMFYARHRLRYLLAGNLEDGSW